MCSITVKLSEYVSGLKSIFGQQWHFKEEKNIFTLCMKHICMARIRIRDLHSATQ
jgi:hypothetical protein